MKFINKIMLLLPLLWAMGCNNAAKKEETESKVEKNVITFKTEQYKNLPIQLGSLRSVQMVSEIAANGLVDVPPDKVFMISFPVNGFINKIEHNLLPGRIVKKGEALATIQSMEFLQLQEDYLNVKTRNELLVQEFNRQKTLFNEDATAKRKLQESENELKINQLKISALVQKLKILGCNPSNLSAANISPYHVLYAQSNGFIKAVNVANGKSFLPTDVLFELVNTDHMHIELKVFGEDANAVKTGQNVQFIDAAGNPVLGKVYLVDKMIDPDKKSLNIHVHIENEKFEQALRPGQYISGKIKADSKTVLALPEAAILSSSEGKSIFLYNKSKTGVIFKKIEVKTGVSSDGFVEILNPGAFKGEVVIKGINFVDNKVSEE